MLRGFISWPTKGGLGQDWNGGTNQPGFEYDGGTFLKSIQFRAR